MQRADVKLVVLAVVVATICVGLGVWQLQRLKGRRARNAVLAARLALPPLDGDRKLRVARARGRHVTAHGGCDFADERTWPGRSFEGTPGVALITPLRLADGSAVLVDRGWVYSPDAFHVDHPRYREPDTTAVTGIAMVAPRNASGE